MRINEIAKHTLRSSFPPHVLNRNSVNVYEQIVSTESLDSLMVHSKLLLLALLTQEASVVLVHSLQGNF